MRATDSADGGAAPLSEEPTKAGVVCHPQARYARWGRDEAGLLLH